MLLVFTLTLASAAPCPPPSPASSAALSPDGGAHVLTASDTTVCWWFIDDDDDMQIVRHFDRLSVTPTRLRWDEQRQVLWMDGATAKGAPWTRMFPAPTATDTHAWGDALQAVR